MWDLPKSLNLNYYNSVVVWLFFFFLFLFTILASSIISDFNSLPPEHCWLVYRLQAYGRLWSYDQSRSSVLIYVGTAVVLCYQCWDHKVYQCDGSCILDYRCLLKGILLRMARTRLTYMRRILPSNSSSHT